MLALLKAGMELPDVLGGAGKSALEFASVGQVAVGDAAEVLTDIMNVFGGTAAQAANIMSSAADSSSVTIEQMVQAFSQASAVAKLADQSLSDTATAIALLGAAGIKGSDAGTSLKSMFLRMINPASEAEGALNSIGLTAKSFIDLDTGKMKAMPEMFDMLNQALSSKAPDEAKRLLAEIFGSDAVRAAAVFTKVGSEGFAKMSDKMKNALPVSEKYKMIMSGLAGSAGNVLAALQRMAIAVSDAVAPALASVVPFITGFIDGLTKLATDNKEAVAGFAKFAVAAVAVGSAMVGLGVSLQVTSFGFAGVGKAAMTALSPLTMLIGAASKVGKSFALVAMPETLKLANTIGSSMLAASGSVTSFASTAGSSLAGFAASGIRSVVSYGNALQGVFASQFRIARFIGQSFGEAAVTAFSKTAMSIGVVKSAVNSIGKPLMSAGRGVLSLAAQIGQLAMPLASVAASSMSRFVSDIAGGLAFTYKSFVWWATGASARMTQYAANVYMAAAATVTSAARMGAAWVASALPGLASFASAAAGVLAKYVGSTVLAAAASVANAVRSGAAWVAAALPGVVAFVGGAVAGIGTYLGAAAMAVAGSVASAAAVAAAWLAPLAPLLLLSAAALGVGAAVKQFGPQIAGAFSGLAGYVTEAGGAIAGGFSTAVSDGITVLGDLATTATTTFNGVYEAVAAGDLSGAMDVLWAGLVAGWLRGTEALMSYVDPWVAAFQDVFTDIGSGIYIAWDKIYTDSSAILNTMGAFIMGFFDNIANGVMATFDNLVAAIQIAWTRVQGYITGAEDTEQRVQAIKDENAARAEQRMQERPGIESRTAEAATQNAQAEKDRKDRVKAIEDDAQATKDGRQAENAKRAADRRAGVVAAEDRLGELTAAKQIGRDAATTAAEDIASTTGASAASPGEKAATAGASAAGAESAVSKGEVAGTFSSLNLGQAFSGGSIAERQLKTLESIDKNTKGMSGEGQVAA
jgi:TP901 family phage tail tape measure protein